MVKVNDNKNNNLIINGNIYNFFFIKKEKVFEN